MRHNEMRNSSYKSFHRKRKIGRGHPKMMSSLEENGGSSNCRVSWPGKKQHVLSRGEPRKGGTDMF